MDTSGRHTHGRHRGHVAGGHALVTEAGAEMLMAGGNAFDAAVAAGFAACLAEPGFTSVGGGGFLLAHTASGREVLFDFFTDTPGRGLPDAERNVRPRALTVSYAEFDQVFHVGPAAVAVPGNVLGLTTVHERLGRLPLEEVVAPAVCMAREGIVLDEAQCRALGLLRDINVQEPAGQLLYEPLGRPAEPGDRLRNVELADFLEALPAGSARDLHGGALGRRLVDDLRGRGGLLTLEDLAGYAVVERDPLVVRFRGRRLVTNPPPSRGGAMIARGLELLEGQGSGSPAWGSGEHLVRAVDVAVRVEREASPAAGGTTHVSVLDAKGNAASLSVSNGEGSGCVAPGTGIMLNNMMGEDDLFPRGRAVAVPGERIGSMMAPTVVGGEGGARLVLGTGGSKRIRSTMVQVISHVLDHGLSLQEAVDAPRFFWDGEALQIEPGHSSEALSVLRRAWPVKQWSAPDLFFGGVHGVDSHTGGVGDFRRDGHALTV